MLAGVWALLPGQSPAVPEPAPPLDYFIVVTGGELLEGVYPDAHTVFITRTLRPLGCRCIGSMVVDDHRPEIQAALRVATNRARVVIVTGGLGPTPNDITRETLSDFTGIPLQESPELLASMERRFQQKRDALRANLRRQTLVPTRGGYLKNGSGTAAGLVFESTPALIVALPGPPRELQTMVRDELAPMLRRRFGVRDFGATLTLRFVGAGQSQIDQVIKDHVAVAPDVTITSLFEGGRVDFSFTLAGNTPADHARLRELARNIREHLGGYIYAADGSSLEEVVLAKLRARELRIAVAEVGSSGDLSAALGKSKGVGEVLAAGVSSPSASGMQRLLRMSANPLTNGLLAVASAAAALPGANSALAVGQAQPGEDGNRYVVACWQAPGRAPVTQRMALGDGGELARARLTTSILDWWRRQLE